MYQRLGRYLLLAVALRTCTTLLLVGCISSTDASSSSTSIPRSSDRIGVSYAHYPPWNPSPNIDDNGFILPKYNRISGEWEKEVKLRKKDRISLHNSPATIRQVPGDGNCLFHSISVAWVHATNGTHLEMKSPDTMEWLYRNSAKLRQLAVDCLEERRKLLFLQGQEYLKATDLVEAAASQYGISGSEYCDLMRQESYWGGGPEIVALCNVLQRPIHVYELHVPEDEDNDEKQKHSRKSRTRGYYRRGYSISSQGSPCSSFVLRRMACFGSPKFDRSPALHILSADSRFPDLRPGEQLESGNHFLAIFPEPLSEGRKSQAEDEEEKKQLIRGGGSANHGCIQPLDEYRDSRERPGWFRKLWTSE